MTSAQGWTLLGLVAVLLSVLGGLIVNQFHLLRAYMDARFDTVDVRFDNLDRDIQALAAALFRRE